MRVGPTVYLWLWLLTCAMPLHAQGLTPKATPDPPSSPKTPVSEAAPVWANLGPQQQSALAPLKRLWPSINEAQKRKWLAVSRNYHELPEQEQQKMHERMREWVHLGPRERALARLEYARAQTLSVDERRMRWQAYQALSKDERKQLADQSPRQVKGAAIAVRPVPADKITPPDQSAQNTGRSGFSALRLDPDKIHPRTLLPLNVPGHASP